MHTKLKLLGVALASVTAGIAGGTFLSAARKASGLCAGRGAGEGCRNIQAVSGRASGTLAYKVRKLARSNPVVLDASTPPAGSFVILAFNSMDNVKAWWNSPAYQAIIPLREKTSTTRAYAVEGVPPS